MREFKQAAKRESALPNAVDIEFSLNDEVLIASPPSTGQLTMFMAYQADGADPSDQAKAVMDLLYSIFDHDQYAWIQTQLLNDDLDVDTLMEVIEYLGEEWSSRPTSSASASSPSRASTGKRSTAKPRSKATTSTT